MAVRIRHGVAVAALLTLGCWGEVYVPPDGRWKVLVVVPDTIRADHLGSNRTGPGTAMPKQGAGWIWLEAYLFSAWGNRKGISLLREGLRLAGRLLRTRACAYFTWRDPLPALVLLARTAKRVIWPRRAN